MKPFLILQLRPEPEASDNEYEAIMDKGRLRPDQTHRICLDKEQVPDGLRLDDYSGVIVGGGPGCVSDDPAKKSALDKRIEDAVLGMMPEIVERDFPFMGCCYGIGILAHYLGAPVNKSRYHERVGVSLCLKTADGRDDPMLAGTPDEFQALVGHKEAVQELPPGCTHLLASDPCPYQMLRYGENVYATQFHPEADAGVFETRIRVYAGYNYFPPEETERIREIVLGADIRWPELILKNFVDRYARD